MMRDRPEDNAGTIRPVEVETVAVDLFAADMRRKLRVNCHKKHWSELSFESLFQRLKEELAELEQAFMSGAAWHEVVDECADVGNLAMMIADKVRGSDSKKSN
jgi:NTP pyrophosphatase (non-canonical NTP hydrolase)